MSLIMDGGTYAYIRDGKKYDGGILGGDIQEAVQGNPQAEEYAHQYKSGVTSGFVLSLLGVAAVIAGAVVTGSEVAQQPQSQTLPPTGPIIMVGGLLVDLIGSIIMLNAAPHLFDAINAYNDGLRPTATPAEPTPSSLPAPQARPQPL